MEQAEAFLNECRALNALLAPLDDADFERVTAFKNWTLNDILRHLHVWNRAADLSLQDGDAFKRWATTLVEPFQKNALRAFERDSVNGVAGRALLNTWSEFYPEMAAHFAKADPSQRLEWVGPTMSARSSITARLMETWAHGQAIYDELGVMRENTDHIKNIVVLGLNTYGWTFINRGETPPEPRPQLVLTAPSGEIWKYGEDACDEKIEGPAEEFCQVVTQTRNIADTTLKLTGQNATRWMANAQCFAGPPNDPPVPGVRRIKQR